MMQSLLLFLNFCSVAVWLGGMVFFSFILTPTLFKSVPKETVGQVLSALFPKYYFLGYVCGTVAVLTQVLAGAQLAGGWLLYLMKVGALVAMVGLTYYAGLVIYPEAHRLKVEIQGKAEAEVPSELRAQFKKTHRLSVLINVAVMLLGFLWIWLLFQVPRLS